MDTQFGESFIPTIVTARYVINDTRKLQPSIPKIIHKINLSFKKKSYVLAYSEILPSLDRKKRSLNDFGRQGSRGIVPRPSNKTNNFWQPVSKRPSPYFQNEKPYFKAGNQTYKLVYNNQRPQPRPHVRPHPRPSSTPAPDRRQDVHPVYKG